MDSTLYLFLLIYSLLSDFSRSFKLQMVLSSWVLASSSEQRVVSKLRKIHVVRKPLLSLLLTVCLHCSTVLFIRYCLCLTCQYHAFKERNKHFKMLINLYLISHLKLYVFYYFMFQRDLKLNSNFSHYVYYINTLVAKITETKWVENLAGSYSLFKMKKRTQQTTK